MKIISFFQNCFQVPCTATSSERSSSYNSCTLPLKPLKGILKKKNNQQENSGNHMREMSYSTMTLPRDILHQCHGQQLHQLEQHQLEQHQLHQQGPHARHQHHGQFEVICCHCFSFFVIFSRKFLKTYFFKVKFFSNFQIKIK